MKNKGAENEIEKYVQMPHKVTITEQGDGTLLAEVYDFPGCMVVVDDYRELKKRIGDVKMLWVETAIKYGWRIPEPRDEEECKGKILLRVPVSDHRRLKINAEREGVSLNTYLVSLVTRKESSHEYVMKLKFYLQELKAIASQWSFTWRVTRGTQAEAVVSKPQGERTTPLDDYQHIN